MQMVYTAMFCDCRHATHISLGSSDGASSEGPWRIVTLHYFSRATCSAGEPEWVHLSSASDGGRPDSQHSQTSRCLCSITDRSTQYKSSALAWSHDIAYILVTPTSHGNVCKKYIESVKLGAMKWQVPGPIGLFRTFCGEGKPLSILPSNCSLCTVALGLVIAAVIL